MATSFAPVDAPLLHHSCFGGALDKANDGILSICFEGYLLLPEGRRRAYFKTEPNGYAMLNEEVGYMLAQCSRLPQPKAAKIWVPGSVLHGIDALRWPNPSQPALCWVTYEAKDRAGKPAPSIKAKLKIGPKNPLTPDQMKILVGIFLKFKLLGRLIAFDSWIANIDRNVGNVLLVSADSFVLIDHGAVLGGAEWPAALHSQPSMYVPTKVLDAIFNPPEATLTLPVKTAIVKECRAISQAYQDAIPWLTKAFDPKKGAQFSQAHEFLQKRVSMVVDQLRTRIGLIP